MKKIKKIKIKIKAMYKELKSLKKVEKTPSEEG